jgi:hypothetical protein
VTFQLDDKVKLKADPKTTGVITGERNCPHAYQVSFDDPELIPPAMFFPEEQLELLTESSDECCPICKTPWHKTDSLVYNTVWYDCLKCGKTKEELQQYQENIEEFDKLLDDVT